MWRIRVRFLSAAPRKWPRTGTLTCQITHNPCENVQTTKVLSQRSDRPSSNNSASAFQDRKVLLLITDVQKSAHQDTRPPHTNASKKEASIRASAEKANLMSIWGVRGLVATIQKHSRSSTVCQSRTPTLMLRAFTQKWRTISQGYRSKWCWDHPTCNN